MLNKSPSNQDHKYVFYTEFMCCSYQILSSQCDFYIICHAYCVENKQLKGKFLRTRKLRTKFPEETAEVEPQEDIPEQEPPRVGILEDDSHPIIHDNDQDFTKVFKQSFRK